VMREVADNDEYIEKAVKDAHTRLTNDIDAGNKIHNDIRATKGRIEKLEDIALLFKICAALAVLALSVVGLIHIINLL